MTRPFNQQVHCPNCGIWITHETSFGRWIRNNPELDSGHGYSVIDQDYWIHQFKRYGGRDFQCLMLVEIKTLGGELTENQRDTLHIANQLMRNRKQKNLSFQAGRGPGVIGKSLMTGKNIMLRAYGMHVLRFSQLGPDDSDWIKWDNKTIDKPTLTELLRFDLDPDTLTPIDLRQHHKATETILEERQPLGFYAERKVMKRS